MNMATDVATSSDVRTDSSLLRADEVTVDYRTGRKRSLRALCEVSIEVKRGETLGLVGESGSGKSTLGRSLAQLPPPTAGSVTMGGLDLTAMTVRQLRPVRHRFQMIFQDPISSLNPRRNALDIVAEPLRLRKQSNVQERALEMLRRVGVNDQMAQRKPHELSGGQCQRVSIARAVIQEPEILICDEPVSALDVSVQAQVINLLESMKAEHDLSMLFISHDLSVVKNISDRVAVLYLGRLCEVAPSTDLYRQPRHHYTDLLLSSVPNPAAPSSSTAPSTAAGESAKGMGRTSAGCPFALRCPAATTVCWTTVPELTSVGPDHRVACHNPLVPVGGSSPASVARDVRS